MSINKFNSEGYYDPTAYEAMSAVEKEERALRAFRPIVYICSPYAGDVSKNVENARQYSRFAVDKGYIPVAPHLLFPQFLQFILVDIAQGKNDLMITVTLSQQGRIKGGPAIFGIKKAAAAFQGKIDMTVLFLPAQTGQREML